MSGIENAPLSNPTFNETFKRRKGELITLHASNVTEGALDENDIKLGVEARVINPDLEHQHVVALWRTADEMAFTMGYSPNNKEEYYDARAAIYRGLSFAFQIVDGLTNEPIDSFSTDYLTEIVQYENPKALLKADVMDYLEQRESISDFITRFISDIDETESMRYSESVELSAGLVFMLSEREYERMYNQAQSDK